MFDADLLGAGLAEIVRSEVGLATKALSDEVASLKAELAKRDATVAAAALSADEIRALQDTFEERSAAMTEGLDRIKAFGERIEALPTVDFDAMKAEIEARAIEAAESSVKAAVASLPITHDGKDGLDAPEVTADQIDASVARYMATNPLHDGLDGKDGTDGKDGSHGMAGKDADPVTEEQITGAVERALEPREGLSNPVAVQVQRWMELNPVRDGKDGTDGRDGNNGADGVGLASALIDKDGELVVTTTKGDAIRLGQIIGRDGKDGADGERGPAGLDGLTLANFDTELSEDGRTLTFVLEDDERRITHELELGGMIYRGVFSDGQAYVKGDTCTWGGSLFIAKGPTSEKPDASKDWALAAKKGRDGRDGPAGKDGDRGLPGNPGKDGKPW